MEWINADLGDQRHQDGDNEIMAAILQETAYNKRKILSKKNDNWIVRNRKDIHYFLESVNIKPS
jgi:hypothetical protein